MEEDWEDWDNEEAQLAQTYLLFSVGDQRYGIGVGSVNEVCILSDIRAVPDVPEYVKGVVNRGGKILPVLDLRIRFNAEPTSSQRPKTIVVEYEDSLVGITVDGVSGVRIIPPNEIRNPIHRDADPNVESLVFGLFGSDDEDVHVLLDPVRLIKDSRRDSLEAATAVPA